MEEIRLSFSKDDSVAVAPPGICFKAAVPEVTVSPYKAGKAAHCCGVDKSGQPASLGK